MTAQCNLIIDSCCDLPYDVVDLEGITVLQFPYLLSDGEHRDDFYRSLSAHEFFKGMRHGEHPSTAQIPIADLTDAFVAAAQSGIPTVYLGFTSKLSGNFETAQMVCNLVLEQFPEAELYTVDTKLASIAEGVLIFEAIRQRAHGLTARELVEWVEEARFFVNEKFMVDDLDSLRRGGRISPSIAVAGTRLNMKPLLTISLDGSLSLAGVARGRKKGIKQLVDYYEKHATGTWGPPLVIIGSADCPRDVERLKEQLVKVDESLMFLETSIGPVIGSHVGPDMLAIAFMGADAREEITVAERIANKIRGH